MGATMVKEARFFQFVLEHRDDDPVKLLLRKPVEGVDMRLAAEQIGWRKRLRRKLPSWEKSPHVWIPSALATEQCSSEATALYKASLVSGANVGCDLTGGMGVDTWALSKQFIKWSMVEQIDDYCEVARHNLWELECRNVEVICGEASSFVAGLSAVDFVYIDPARRGESDRRLFDLADYQPNVHSLLPALRRLGAEYMIKVSPMADVTDLVRQIGDVAEVVVVSVRNECKELLLRGGIASGERGVNVRCVNLLGEGVHEEFCFVLEQEAAVAVDYAEEVQTYLYEPNASVMKSGGYRSVGQRYGVKKLHVNTHLYTSEQCVDDFPGRRFVVEEVIPFASKEIKSRSGRFGQANVTCRNFPLTVEEVRRKLKIKEGGEEYLFAATVGNSGDKTLIKCRKVGV